MYEWGSAPGIAPGSFYSRTLVVEPKSAVNAPGRPEHLHERLKRSYFHLLRAKDFERGKLHWALYKFSFVLAVLRFARHRKAFGSSEKNTTLYVNVATALQWRKLRNAATKPVQTRKKPRGRAKIAWNAENCKNFGIYLDFTCVISGLRKFLHNT